MIALFTGYIDFILCIGSRVKIPHRDATVIMIKGFKGHWFSINREGKACCVFLNYYKYAIV